MKSGIVKCATIILLSLFMLGCSSIRARTEPTENKLSVYPGVQLDANDTLKLFSSNNSDPFWLKGIMLVIYTIDLPFSSIFDTAVAPYDLYKNQAAK